MEGLFSVLGVSLSGFNIVLPRIEKYRKNRQIKDELANALGEDIKKYKSAFDDLKQIKNDLLMLSLEAFKDGVSSRDKVNAVVDSVSQLYTVYGKIINQFIRLAEDCKGVSLNSAFMDDLKKCDSFLHDYVFQMVRMPTNLGTVG